MKLSNPLRGLGRLFDDFVLETALNRQLLEKVLRERGVDPVTIAHVYNEIQEQVMAQRGVATEENLTEVFRRHGIGQFAGVAYQELRKDPPALSYGTIGMF